MARIDYWQYMVDSQGRPLPDAEVRVYLAGTLTEADIYLNSTFGSFSNSSTEDLKTNKFGFVQFWIGDEWEVEGGYTVDQQFKIVWQNAYDAIEEEIDDLYVFSPLKPIEVSDSIQGEPDARDLNRVISNKQGKRWNDHIAEIVPSASPHDLQPIEFFDLDTKHNRVISNKLGYQLYEMSETASITPIDISAARLYEERVVSWTASGGQYYRDIRHDFNNYYPIVRVYRHSNDNEMRPKRIQSQGPDYTRVWMADSLDVNIAVYG